MTKEEVKERIYQIQNMGRNELNLFLKKVEVSLLEPKAKTFLFRAIEVRMAELDPDNAMAECGEIKFSEGIS
jgi:hypothetical protein